MYCSEQLKKLNHRIRPVVTKANFRGWLIWTFFVVSMLLTFHLRNNCTGIWEIIFLKGYGDSIEPIMEELVSFVLFFVLFYYQVWRSICISNQAYEGCRMCHGDSLPFSLLISSSKSRKQGCLRSPFLNLDWRNFLRR